MKRLFLGNVGGESVEVGLYGCHDWWFLWWILSDLCGIDIRKNHRGDGFSELILLYTHFNFNTLTTISVELLTTNLQIIIKMVYGMINFVGKNHCINHWLSVYFWENIQHTHAKFNTMMHYFSNYSVKEKHVILIQ